MALWALGLAILFNAAFRLIGIAEGLSTGAIPVGFDAPHYFEHLPLTLTHLVPGLLFVLLGPLQFSSHVRQQWPLVHRVSGRLWATCGLLLGVAGVVMNKWFPPVGGPLKYWSTHLFGIALVMCIALGIAAILGGRVDRHRRWMVRAFAIGLAPSTQRLLFFPVFAVTGRIDEQVIDVVMSVGWVVNVVAAELILWRASR
ncbi:MAG: DUF2306 domain-containing protein [Myxococcales bacterium]|nr:DUF2306 domain-containing protein [Myxococcales bacterium]